MEIVVKTYGINTFKHFMAYKGALMVNDDELYNSFARCAHLGAMPLVHAENGDVVARMQEALLARGVTGPEGHAYSRPPEVEGEATNRAIMIADMTGAPLYVVHTSCREAHEAIARARAAGKRVYGEPLIQHLLLDASEYANKDWDHAARRVMSPPFRDKAHQDSLWAGLQSGSLQVVATDHCAFTTEQKRLGIERLPQDPERHRRARGPHAAAVDRGRQHRAADQGGIRRGDLRQHRPHPQHLSAQGRGRRRLRCRSRGLGPGGEQDHHARRTQLSRIDYNVFEGFACTGAPVVTLSRGKIAWKSGDLRAETRRRPLCRAAGVLAGACRQFDLEGSTRAQGGRSRRDRALIACRISSGRP